MEQFPTLFLTVVVVVWSALHSVSPLLPTSANVHTEKEGTLLHLLSSSAKSGSVRFNKAVN